MNAYSRDRVHQSFRLWLYSRIYWTAQCWVLGDGLIFTSNISNLIFVSLFGLLLHRRSQWPRGLRRRSSTARLLRLWVRTPPAAWMFVCCECCVLSGRGLCDGLITRPEVSYRLWRVVVCDQETSKTRRLKPATGLWKIQPQWVVTPGNQTNVLYHYITMHGTKRKQNEHRNNVIDETKDWVNSVNICRYSRWWFIIFSKLICQKHRYRRIKRTLKDFWIRKYTKHATIISSYNNFFMHF